MESANIRVRLKAMKPRANASTTDANDPSMPGAHYNAASWKGRYQVWKFLGGGPNRVSAGALPMLCARIRDTVRRNGIADAASEILTTNAIRYGIKPQWNTGDKTVDRALAKEFGRWCWQADAAGRTDFYGQQAMAFRSMVDGGDVFGRMRTRFPRDNMRVPLQVQLMESEFCPVEKNTDVGAAGGRVINGIEFDKNIPDRRKGYWLYPSHPAESMFAASGFEPAYVPAEDIVHLAMIKRPGQVRGEPMLARSLDKMRDLDTADDGVVQRFMLQAFMVGFIQPQLTLSSPFPNSTESTTTPGVGEGPLQPGTIQQLGPGETVQFSQPPDVGSTYEAWFRNQLRQIARSTGILYEQLSGDYNGVNDRTWRAAMSDQDGLVQRWQYHMVIPQFVLPIVQRWVLYAVTFGAVKLPPGVLLEDCMWPKMVPAPRPYINPVQDVQAKALEVRNGFASRSEKVSEQGYDAADVDEETAADRKREDSLDIVYDTNGNHVNATGVIQVDPADAADAPPASKPPVKRGG